MVLSVLRSRKVTKRVLTALLILIIPAFVLWGVNSTANKPRVVGKINGRPVKLEDFMRSINGIKAELILAYSNNYDMINQFWKNQSFVNTKAWERLILLNAAKKQKIRISDKDVMDFILHHPLFLRNGQFDMRTYEIIVQNNFSFSPHDFEELIRENLTAETLRKKILSNIAVSDTEIYNYYKKINDKFAFSYILISPDSFKKDVSISEDMVKEFYNATKENYFDPKKIEIEYIEFPFTSLSEKTPAEREAKEIVGTLRKTSGSLADLSEASGFKYKKPEPFSKNDPLPGMKFSKELQTAVFSLKENEISDPIIPYQEKGSIYIIRKIRDIPRRSKDFDEVKTAIRDALIEQKSFSLAENKAEALYKDVNNNGVSLEDAALSITAELQKTSLLTMNGYIENIGPAKDLVELASGTAEDIVLPPLRTKKGILLARVDEIQAADKKVFEKQKENLRKFLSFQKERTVMNKWLEENSKNTEFFVE